jgi:uncharacterized iron-regulated protein
VDLCSESQAGNSLYTTIDRSWNSEVVLVGERHPTMVGIAAIEMYLLPIVKNSSVQSVNLVLSIPYLISIILIICFM